MTRVLFLSIVLTIFSTRMFAGQTPETTNPKPLTAKVSVADISIIANPETQTMTFWGEPESAFEVEILDNAGKMLGWAETSEWDDGKVIVSLGHYFPLAAVAVITADGTESRMTLHPDNPKYSVVVPAAGQAPQPAAESGQGNW